MSIGPGLIGSSVVIQVKRKQWRLDFSTPGRGSGLYKCLEGKKRVRSIYGKEGKGRTWGQRGKGLPPLKALRKNEWSGKKGTHPENREEKVSKYF